jgi:hypothetical protein
MPCLEDHFSLGKRDRACHGRQTRFLAATGLRMRDMLELKFLSGMLGGDIDWTVLIAFLVIALVAFLSPVVGYEPKRPKGIAAALILLVLYMVLGIFEYAVLWFGFFNEVGENNIRPGRGGNSSSNTHFLFSVVRLIIFVVAMLTFALGVLCLRVRKPTPRAEPDTREWKDIH